MNAILFGPITLALVHLIAGHIRFDERLRPFWLSFSGGVAIAYVFIHILPVLYRFVDQVSNHEDAVTQGEWIFGLALLGTCSYYAIEKLILSQEKSEHENARPGYGGVASFVIHIGAFTLYNFLIGYLLTDYPPEGLLDILAVYGALALHFLVVDRDLREHHERIYDRLGQWLMAAAVILGGLAGLIELLPPPVMAAGFAFLAGGMILNVFKEELPQEAKSRLVPFITGATIFGILFVLA